MSTQAHPGNTLDSLMEDLGRKDGMLRQSARKSLVAMGAPAVDPLALALRDSTSDQVRWEAAKALGEIGDARAVPALVKALEDKDTDVVWLAAEALTAFGMAAWPTLLKALINEGTESVILRKGAHHVLHKQKQSGYNDLLAILTPALELDALPESASMAASDILNRMRANP
jgi:HEAT repeat protein